MKIAMTKECLALWSALRPRPHLPVPGVILEVMMIDDVNELEDRFMKKEFRAIVLRGAIEGETEHQIGIHYWPAPPHHFPICFSPMDQADPDQWSFILRCIVTGHLPKF